MEIILASKSPRRCELLKQVVKNFIIDPSMLDESLVSELDPVLLVRKLALGKGLEVNKTHKNALIISADTIVELNGEILGKPKTATQAKTMLQLLSGKVHNVHTGLCVMCQNTVVCEVITTEVTFKSLDNIEIDKYIATGSPFDKAGGYGIQDCNFVKSIIGSYDNVMGLPTEQLKEILKKNFGGKYDC